MKSVAFCLSLIGTVLLAGHSHMAAAQSGRVKVVNPTAQTPTAPAAGGYLGVFLGDITDERAKELKLPEVRGALIGRVVEESPAAKAGLRADDVILSYNGERVFSASQMHRLLMETPPGRKVTLEIYRAGARHHIEVTIGERPASLKGLSASKTDYESLLEAIDRLREEAQELRRQFKEEEAKKLLEQAEDLRRHAEELYGEKNRLPQEGKLYGFGSSPGGRFFYGFGQQRYVLGVSVAPLSEQLAQYFNVKDGRGVLITEVEANSAAERAGLKAGDCITAVNGERVSSAADLTRLLNAPGQAEKAEKEVEITLVRDRQEQMIKVKPDRREVRYPNPLRRN